MKTKAFVILPESEAVVDFAAQFPVGTEMAVLPDDVFHDLVERAKGLGSKTASTTEFAGIDQEPEQDATEDVISDLDVISVDGC